MATPLNHLIELLPRREKSRLLALCEPVELVLSEVLCEQGRPTSHVYLPTEGFISLLTRFGSIDWFESIGLYP